MLPQINELESIDELEREQALRPIRDHNFDVLIEWLGSIVPTRATVDVRPTLLDVGCAHGWFIEKARVGYDVLGIEPDDVVASATQRRNLPVRMGYFPDSLRVDETFDVIVFNDVLEHIPDVKKVLNECSLRIPPGGVVVVNAPDRCGLFYRCSKLLAKIGRKGTFERMWQVGLQSPHLYYFDRNSMDRLALATGFRVMAARQLPSVVARGLYARIHHTGNTSRFRSVVLTTAIFLALPLLMLFHSDISVWVLEKQQPKE